MWSFDIFDTCVVRRYAVPTDLFLELGEKLGHQLRPILGPDFRDVFREARVEAERLAILDCVHEEITLAEIWQKLVTIVPQLDAEGGMQYELALEADSLVVVASAAELIQQGRKLYGRVLFISDTYFPRWFVEQLLKRFKLLLEGDELFLSSEVRRTKRSGALFDFMLVATGLSAGSILHHGDNVHSDVRMAKVKGLNTRHLDAALATRHEREIGAQLKHLDSLRVACMLGSMRIARLSSIPDRDNLAARSLVATFIGPFLWVFADWILHRAAANGTRRLYFFSRDCHGLYHVARHLAARIGLDIDCRYLRVSRQALLLPSVTDLSSAGVPWLRRTWESGELGSVLAKLGLDYREAEVFFERLAGNQRSDFRLSTDEQWQEFWSILQRSELKALLTSRIEKRRHEALAFFSQEGLLDELPLGFVDLGWHQSCQAALTKLLRLRKPDIDARAYYLALVNGRGRFIRECPAEAVFHQAPNDRRSNFADVEIFGRISILEHVLNCAPHGSISRYALLSGSECSALAEEKDVSTQELLAKAALYRELESFAKHHVERLNLSDAETRTTLASLLMTTAKSPQSLWVELLRDIEVADDQNNRDSRSMVRPRGVFEFVADALRGRSYQSLSLQQTGVWPELSLAASPQFVAKLYGQLEQMNRLRRVVKRSLKL